MFSVGYEYVGGGKSIRLYPCQKIKANWKHGGWGAAAAICTGSGCADVAITINNRNIRTQKGCFLPPLVCACSGLSGPVRLRRVCFAWVNLCAYRNSPPIVTLPPCPSKFWFPLKNRFYVFIINIYYNRTTINAQRIHAGYLRLLACVICPRGRGLIVGRVICVWYIGRDE